MFLIIEIVIAIFAFNRGWRFLALIPIVIEMLAGVMLAVFIPNFDLWNEQHQLYIRVASFLTIAVLALMALRPRKTLESES